MAIQLGPNHPDDGKPVGPVSQATGRKRTGRPPRQMVVTPIVENGPAPGTHYTPTQLLRAYSAAHDRVVGSLCGCVLCADFRYLLEQARARREGERNGR